MSVVPPAPVRMLDRYVMLETLGKGGFSKVKLGLDPSTSPPTRVALKVLKQSSLASSSHTVVEAVRREIHAMTVVQHRHVLRLRDVRYDVSYPKKDGRHYPVILIVLDLALGGELFDVLSYTGAFDEQLARTYFHQLVDAVGSCHGQGICHRDLKPENLLLDDHFGLLVSDFGLSHTMMDDGRRKLLHTTCGTMAYIAPEVLAGRRKGYDGSAADVWSCGVILFILVASFPPFQQPDLNDWWYNKLATGRPHLFWAAHVRSVPFSDGLQNFLTKLLEVDPGKRITVGDMRQDEWFSGPTLSAESLQEKVRQRKAEVDVRKMQEKAERERQRRQQEAATRGGNDFASSRFLSDADDTYRAYDEHADSTSDQLPPTQPAMALGTLDGAAGGEEGLMAALHTMDQPPAPSKPMFKVHMRMLSRSVAPSSPPPKAAAPVPVYDPELTVPTLTLLTSALPVSELHMRLMSLLTHHRFTVKHNEEQHRYKATTQTLMGDVVLTIQLWRKAEGDSAGEEAGELLLECRRRSGDSGQYRELFTGLLMEMTSAGLISSTPTG